MFLHHDIKGSFLPDRTLCLTYDDGPGPDTDELGKYLHEQGIEATFFVVGRHARQYPETLRHLFQWGHTIANHTDTHPGLVSFTLAGGDVIGELARCDETIAPFQRGDVRYFRAPYGNWRAKRPPDFAEDDDNSVVANILNASGRFANYVGPVNWDISAADYDFWQRSDSPLDAAEAYLREIERTRRGIVLLHDSSEDFELRDKNRTWELTMLLVPILKDRGYRFASLAAVTHASS